MISREAAEDAKPPNEEPQRLSTLRQWLRPTLAASPLTDGADYARALENAFLEMWAAVGGPARA